MGPLGPMDGWSFLVLAYLWVADVLSVALAILVAVFGCMAGAVVCQRRGYTAKDNAEIFLIVILLGVTGGGLIGFVLAVIWPLLLLPVLGLASACVRGRVVEG